MSSYTLSTGSPDKSRADVVVVGVVRTAKGVQAAPGGEAVASAFGRRFAPLLSTMGFTGRVGETAKLPTGGAVRSPLVVLVGLGERDDVDPAGCRRAAGVAMRSISNAASVVFALPAPDEAHVQAVVEGSLLGAYAFSAYKTTGKSTGKSKDKQKTPPEPAEVVVLTGIARTKGAQRAVEVGRVVAEATMLARDWVNTPAGDLAPEGFADAVVAAHAGRRPGRVKVAVTREPELRAQGFGGILGVGQGSSNDPCLVQVSYTPRGAKTHLALVGKGITFDSGGLSIKTAAGMTTMKCDMAGAAAVVAATLAIAELGLPVRVTALAPMAENMVSGEATRPGDVLTMYGGKTVEVLNTDAEGRLVLADGLVLAGESAPDLVVDVATLTGACVTALGDRVAGIMGNDDDLVEAAISAGARAGEPLWQLPITAEMTERVRTNSTVADLMQHNTGTYGGALYAAAFLQEFVGDTRWAHLDIAGPAFNTRGPHGHVPSGGTGFGVGTLVELAHELTR